MVLTTKQTAWLICPHITMVECRGNVWGLSIIGPLVTGRWSFEHGSYMLLPPPTFVIGRGRFQLRRKRDFFTIRAQQTTGTVISQQFFFPEVTLATRSHILVRAAYIRGMVENMFSRILRFIYHKP